MEKLLITGISGGQGQLLASRVDDAYEVAGIDRVPWEGHPKNVKIYVVDVPKKKFEDVLRHERPHAVVHLGQIRHFRAEPSHRHDVNVVGTETFASMR